MTRILRSVFAIAIVAVLAVGVSRAAFSDTEETTENNYGFETGTIDIAVDGHNPWELGVEDKYVIQDMKPSFTGYLTLKVKNVGTNPANIWKTLSDYQYSDAIESEPECDAEGGTWDQTADVGLRCTDNNNAKDNISGLINYDMRVELYMTDDATEPVWWETIYMDSDNVTLASLQGKKMYLGMLPVGWTMKVIQSYHMIDDAGNRLQGDKMTYDISFFAEELTNTVRLVNKYEADTDVSHHVWNGQYADFTYKVMDDELRWTLETTNVPDGDYTLLVWDDTAHSYAWDWSTRSDAVVLAHLTDTGNMTHSGEINIGNVTNAKVWLVPGTFGTVEGSADSFPWNATDTFFETGLVDYYDSL